MIRRRAQLTENKILVTLGKYSLVRIKESKRHHILIGFKLNELELFILQSKITLEIEDEPQ